MYIGIDLGGTNIAAGLVDESGTLKVKVSTPTLKFRSPDKIASDMVKLINRLLGDTKANVSDLSGVGIGIPGTVNDKTGEIVYAVNLNMNGFNIADYIRQNINVPVHLANDADCAALGEYTVSGNDASRFVFVTLGTGVGGGVVLDGKIYTGFNGIGSELGHMTLIKNGERCGCGKRGCYEAYASVTALVRDTKKAMEYHPESIMNKLAAVRGKVSGRTAFDAMRQGDEAAAEVVKNYAEYVAEGIVSIENIFQPEVLVIGCGISKEGDYLLKPVREYVEKYRYNKHLKQTEIKIARLFNDAGIIGAAMLCK